MQNCCEPCIICEGLGYSSVACAKEKIGCWCSKHFVKFTGINLCRRLIFDKLAIKLPAKIVGLKFSYVSCLEVVSSRSHNS